MARTNEHYHENRDKLASQILKIFIQKGYENTTLSIIIKELDISKGAFYHYFSTKEECANRTVELYANNMLKKLESNMSDEKSAKQYFKDFFMNSARLASEDVEDMNNINAPSNRIFHQKMMVELIKAFSPILEKAIRKGIDEHKFECKYPRETAEMILTLTNFYFDSDLFGWVEEELERKLLAFNDILSRILNTEENILD